MLKQSSSKMKKVLAILMAVLFGVSVTAVAVSAEPVVVTEKKKAAKGVAVDRENGKIKAVKGVAINKETGEIVKGVAINKETGEIKTAKGMAIGNENGEIKAAKGVAINKKPER